MAQINNDVIEHFLNGSDPQKYIIGIETEYAEPSVTLIVNDPETGKRLEKHTYKPFCWFKRDITQLIYDGKRMKILNACAKWDVKITALKVNDENGHIPQRLENGYRFLATCKKSYNHLINFFREGGVDVFAPEYSKLFLIFSPAEQFLIQSGKRLFKGIDDYNDVHRFQFDLETEGLDPSRHAIFQIGVKDNRGWEGILDISGNTLQERRDSERIMIGNFFKLIDIKKPDIIAGYNSDNFDWDFLFQRCERLSIPVSQLAISLQGRGQIRRKKSTLKLGGEVEKYMQTTLFGYNIVDIAHSVRRAMAINSDIQKWNLKYITQFSDVAKPNRVYVNGNKINKLWADTENDYAFNDKNGDWYKITDKIPVKEEYHVVKGKYIIERYLLDDLWETEKVDLIFNQASFLIAKMLPTTYVRSITMGTAGQWKLLMSAWSYENKLAIPETEEKRKFTGGLSRLLRVGYAKNVVKLDYAALYPKTELTWDIFPDLDITGVMKGLLTYIVDTRDKYKFLLDDAKKERDRIKDEIKDKKDTCTPEELEELNRKFAEIKMAVSLYDKKQLPLKILANSWFGSYGAPYIFNWGETDCAEETTCRGRQYLRLMVHHFHEKHGFQPLVGDSVTYNTPVYVKKDFIGVGEFIDILPICDLFDSNSKFLDKEGLRDYSEKPYEILTRNGWKDIKYVYRHETDKNIHRITTKDRLLDVTEDHSLFQNNFEIKPSQLKRGDIIDTYDIPLLPYIDIALTEKIAYLDGFFLGDGSANCSPRVQKYTSKKTGEIHLNKGKRSDWKISNTNIDFLKELQFILNSLNIESEIKNHLKSSGVYNLVVHNTTFANNYCRDFYTSYREKKVPIRYLNSDINIKKAFMDGVCASDGYGNSLETCSDIGMKSQISMAGLSYILKSLGSDYKIKTRKDKINFISFSLKNSNRGNSKFTELTKKKTNEVWKNDIIQNIDKNNFVYDVSTEDGTFICGIGGVIAHNTDGFNFSYPDNVDDFKYTARGDHWKTTKYAGQTLSGLDAVLAEFNETYMIGRMGLDIDDIYTSTINFSRKNYANLVKGKVKLVGNSVKSKKMPIYIEEFIQAGIKMLLNGKGKEFIEYYYEYIDKIYNYKIPVVKIASKSKINTSISEYKKKATKLNKAGKPLPKQAHMELAIREGLDLNNGDVLYYINTGTAKSHGDLKSIKNKETGITEVQLNCKLIDAQVVENNFDVLKEIEYFTAQLDEETDQDKIAQINASIKTLEDELYTSEYNIPRFLSAFNKKVTPLLVCFDPEIRDTILIDIVKDKKTKLESLAPKSVFTAKQCTLSSGFPLKSKTKPQDDYHEDLMTMEDKEIKFWDKVNKIPNNMEDAEWETIRADYHERMRIEREQGIQREKDDLVDIFKRLEIKDLNNVMNRGILPMDVFIIADIDVLGSNCLISRRWDVPLWHINNIFDFEKEAVERSHFYQMNDIDDNDIERYEKWEAHRIEQSVMISSPLDADSLLASLNVEKVTELLKDEASKVVIPTETLKLKKDDFDHTEDEDEDDEETVSDDIVVDEIDDFAFVSEEAREALLKDVTPITIYTAETEIENKSIIESIREKINNLADIETIKEKINNLAEQNLINQKINDEEKDFEINQKQRFYEKTGITIKEQEDDEWNF